jgi:hypothetical protein
MSYSSTFRIGGLATTLTLSAQLITTAGAPSGVAVTTGFYEIGGGDYTWTGTIPDDFQGAVTFSISGGAYQTAAAINTTDDPGNAGGGGGATASELAAAIAGLVNLIILSPATASTLDVFRGDSYQTANGRAITITKVANETHWPTTLSTVHLTAKPTANTLLDYSSAASLTNILCTIVRATDSGSNLQSFTLELTNTQLATLTAKDLIAGYRFWIVANKDTAPATLRTGNMTVRKDTSEA